MCPHCNEGMQAIQRNEVEIDVYPSCRGVWLDPGELEKLLGTVREDKEEMESMRKYVPKDWEPPHGKHRKKKKGRIFDIFEIFE